MIQQIFIKGYIGIGLKATRNSPMSPLIEIKLYISYTTGQHLENLT